MAQEKNVTPEKQLLKLIEDPKSKKTRTLQTHKAKLQGLSVFSFSVWLSRVLFLRDKLKKWFKERRFTQLDFGVISRILGVCVFILLAYLANDLYQSIKNLRNIGTLGFETPKELKSISFPEVSILKKTPSYYLERVRERNIFGWGEVKKEVEEKVVEEEVVVTPTTEIIKATAHLKLVGISWSDDPDALIEDTRALRTFFVKRGHMIGNIKVEAIFKDKVILSCGGEEVELK